MEELAGGTMEELDALTRVFLWKDVPPSQPDEETKNLWRRRYESALAVLHHAGIKTGTNGAEKYVEMHAGWDGYFGQLVPSYGYSLDDIDPALAKVKQATAA